MEESFFSGFGFFLVFEGRRDTKTTVVCLCVLELLANTSVWETWVGWFFGFIFFGFIFDIFTVLLHPRRNARKGRRLERRCGFPSAVRVPGVSPVSW